MSADLRREVQSLLSDMPNAATYCNDLFNAGDHSAYISIGNVLRQYAGDLTMRVYQLQARAADCNAVADRMVALSDAIAPKYNVVIHWPGHSVAFTLSINPVDRRYSLISGGPEVKYYDGDGVTVTETVIQQGDVIVYTKQHQPDEDIDMEPWIEYSAMVIVKPGAPPRPCMDHTYHNEHLDDKMTPPTEFSIIAA